MKRVSIIQPILTNYCWPVFAEMSGYCQVDLIYSPSAAESGFGDVTKFETPNVRHLVVPTFKPLGERLGMIQWGIAKYIFREGPDAIITFANPRYLSFWMTLLLGKLLGIPTYAHGHGLFKKHKINFVYRITMILLLKLVDSYICYAPIVRQSFIDHGFPYRKLSVAHNSLINRFPVRPEEKTGNERGVLFVGRLRKGNDMGLLARAMERIRQSDGIPLTLHVIGAGEGAQQLRKETSDYPWIVLHGGTYDQERIREISLDCFLGCYPGNAGLSVVHMMSLSLPVITHDNLSSHQGPEPSFIRNGMSGVLYDHRNPEESLYKAIRSLASGTHQLARMRRAAYEDYQSLVNPPLSARFWSILSSGQDSPQEGSFVVQKWAPRSPAESKAKGNDSFLID
jgi:glycosyltransferase involved in cell wall biosynthesis